jgi:protein-tyrosine-phosphatase
MRVLFVCTHNISRSRVAEDTFRILAWTVPGRERHEARSAGITPQPGGRVITRADVEWADLICVMEPAHEALIRARWPLHGSKIRVFGIPDDHQPDDPALRDLMMRHIRDLLAEAASRRSPAVPGTGHAPGER